MRVFSQITIIAAAVGLSGYIITAAMSQTTTLGPSMTSVSTGASGAGSMAALAANPSRKALTVCNNDATNKLTISTGSLSPVSLTTGIVLLNGNVASSCITFGQPGGVASGGVGAQVNITANGANTVATFIEYY